MEQPQIPNTGVVRKSVAIGIACKKEAAFDYISSGDALPMWLRKTGPIHGAVKVEVIKGPYNFVGATRHVTLEAGDGIIETLTYYDRPVYYSYSVTNFQDFLKHLVKMAYGQLWFEDVGNNTHVVWVYTFVPKNVFAKAVVWLFLTLFYKKFMNQSLQLAKAEIEKLQT